MKHPGTARFPGFLQLLPMLLFSLLFLADQSRGAEPAQIKTNVDTVVEALNTGGSPTRFNAEAFTPYVFIMESSGRLLVHPYLTGEYLQEKAGPIYQALQQATREGLWVSYLWKGATKQTYVRRTEANLIVGSGY